MRDAFIVSALRTPIGKKKGTLSNMHPADLGAVVLSATFDQVDLDPELVEDVIFGHEGVSKGANSRSLLIDFSTTIVASTKEMARRLKEETNMGWIDAPVSGGPDACRDGRLRGQ